MKMPMIHPIRILPFAVLAALGAGCGGAVKAKVQLSNASTSALVAATAGRGSDISILDITDIPSGATPVTPTAFKMKIIQAYLVEDVDISSSNNVGKVQRIWVNPDCSSDNGCTDANVGLFDLIDPTAANAKLNSQNLDIDMGTYRYVRVEFCQGGASGNNVQYQVSGGSVIDKTYGGCAVTSKKMEPALELKIGDNVTIALDYNLNDGELYSISAGDCTATAPCLSSIGLSPRIVS